MNCLARVYLNHWDNSTLPAQIMESSIIGVKKNPKDDKIPTPLLGCSFQPCLEHLLSQLLRLFLNSLCFFRKVSQDLSWFLEPGDSSAPGECVSLTLSTLRWNWSGLSKKPVWKLLSECHSISSCNILWGSHSVLILHQCININWDTRS